MTERERLGTIVKQIRKMKGIKQVPFSRSMGVSQGALSKIESGILLPPTPMLIRLRNSCTGRELRVFEKIWRSA